MRWTTKFLAAAGLVLLYGIYSWTKPTEIGTVLESSAKGVRIRGRFWSWGLSLSDGDTLTLTAPGAFAYVQAQGGIRFRLTPVEKSDSAELSVGYWWEFGGGPYQFLTLKRGRIALSAGGPVTHRWTTVVSAPKVEIYSYAPPILAYSVQVDADVVTVRTASDDTSGRSVKVEISSPRSTYCSEEDLDAGTELVIKSGEIASRTPPAMPPSPGAGASPEPVLKTDLRSVRSSSPASAGDWTAVAHLLDTRLKAVRNSWARDQSSAPPRGRPDLQTQSSDHQTPR